MTLTLLAPVSLAQAAGQLGRQGTRVPGLEALLANSVANSAAEVSGPALDFALAELLGVRGDGPPPFAALRLATENSPFERDRHWLCADPVATSLLIDNAQVDAGAADLTRDEADALVASFNDEFAHDGLTFIAPDPSRWYVRCPSCPPPQRVATTPLWRAIGGPMREALPAGDDGPRWRARLNQSQMLLFAHPVNVEREAAGRARIGSLWWWGEGSWPEFGVAEVDQVIGGPRWVRAACQANGIAQREHGEHGAFADAIADAQTKRVLCVAGGEWEPAGSAASLLSEWDERWFRPLAGALDAGHIAAATLLLGWDDRTLCVACAAPKRPLWRRWIGSRTPVEAPALKTVLGGFDR